MEREIGRRRPRRRSSKKNATSTSKEESTTSKEEEEEEEMRYIPEEIIRIILLKLPLESLIRFRFVSRQWRSLISPNIKQNLIFPYDNNLSRTKESRRHFRSIDQTLSQVAESTVVVPEKTDTTPCRMNVHICGSCNGLLLVKVGVFLLLWDPSDCSRRGSILCCKRLRNYPCEKDRHNINPSPRVQLGLCFDPDNQEYKVVLALKEEKGWDRCQVLVGSFGNRTWKHVTLLFGIRFEPSPSLVVNGNLHWLVFDEDRFCERILCFDPKTDRFVDDLPLPRVTLADKRLCVVGVGALDGCICISHWESPTAAAAATTATVEVSVMERYGVGETWTKLLKFERKYGVSTMVPLFFTDERKLLMQERDQIVAYDMDNDVFNRIAFTNYANNEVAVVYEETLENHRKNRKHEEVWQVVGTSEQKEMDLLAATPQIVPWS